MTRNGLPLISRNYSLRYKIIKSENYIIISLDLAILEKMIELKDIPELHDKIIVSTAKYLDLPLITKDSVLHNLSNIKIFW